MRTINMSIALPFTLFMTILKLTNVIDCSWWIVTIAYWLPLLAFAALVAIAFTIAFIRAILEVL